ncbi:MAG: hypothetical protein ACOCSR_00715, partial [Wenzhouxiangella sp.]
MADDTKRSQRQKANPESTIVIFIHFVSFVPFFVHFVFHNRAWTFARRAEGADNQSSSGSPTRPTAG